MGNRDKGISFLSETEPERALVDIGSCLPELRHIW
jgi:hypothetical protein